MLVSFVLSYFVILLHLFQCWKLSPVERDPYIVTPTSEAAKSPPSGDDNSNPITTDKTFHALSNDDQEKESSGNCHFSCLFCILEEKSSSRIRRCRSLCVTDA